MSVASETAVTVENSLEKKMEATDLKDNSAPSSMSSVAASLREKQHGIMKTPFVDPAPSSRPMARPDLSSDQAKKYEEVLETVKGWAEVPSNKGKAGPITDKEIMWLTKDCLLRYLRATKWNVNDAAKRILATLTWRRDFMTEEMTGDYISPENETGKQVLLGYDVAARPCLYLNPGKQNTEPSPRQVQHLVFMVERVTEMMVPGQEQLALLINFKSGAKRSNTSPPLSQGKEVLSILQGHYPERLGRACIINVPWVVWGFFKLITPFIDPLTREKLKFNEDVRQYVPPAQLIRDDYKGDVDFEYEHDVYWPALLKLCEERRAERERRWVAAGKGYGVDEDYLRGAGPILSHPSAASDTVQDEEKAVETAHVDMHPEIVSPIVQSHGRQANGNTDLAAQTADPVLTMEGDRA